MDQDEEARQSIINSIETRWAKSDQEIFVAAVLVNPLFRMSIFQPLARFNTANIRDLFVRLYKRFYRREPPRSFITHAYDFLEGKGFFATLRTQVRDEIHDASEKVRAFLNFNYELKLMYNCISEASTRPYNHH